RRPHFCSLFVLMQRFEAARERSSEGGAEFLLQTRGAQKRMPRITAERLESRQVLQLSREILLLNPCRCSKRRRTAQSLVVAPEFFRSCCGRRSCDRPPARRSSR